ncbi:MAG: exodeoxyribonuclease I [Sphaerochaetaceae bacterium]|nr:exodeoxyribonuclease I [Sphaerochaetaceae bacterium]
MSSTIESFFWYDLETFGTDPFNDRIAQFAGIRTDTDLNPIGDPVMLYCRLSPDYIPQRSACAVTGIVPQTLKEKKAIPESEFIEQINSIFSVRGTCVAGFNNIKFDDEFIRNALYRNFLDPYEREYKNNCSRWDIINLVRACHDLRPQGINWPYSNEEKRPVFKLTAMTEANNIEQVGAHDALVDVMATIAVAKLIKEKQPRLYEYYLSLRDKKNVMNVLGLGRTGSRPVLYTNNAFRTELGATTLILPLTVSNGISNNVICINLAEDPAPLISAAGGRKEDLEKVIFDRDNPLVVRIAVNRIPFIAPANTINEKDYVRLGIDRRICLQHMETIVNHYAELVSVLKDFTFGEQSQPVDPDCAIYSGFFSDYDKSLFRMIRRTEPARRLELDLNFQDPRCRSMLWRHVCRNYPELLTPKQLESWKYFAVNRLMSPPGGGYNIYQSEEDIKLELNNPETDEKTKAIYSKLLEYLVALRKYLGMNDRAQ